MTTVNTEIQVLVVDDEEIVRNFVARLLNEHGYRVIKASGGKEALEILKKETVDLLILDIVMPEIDGFMLLELMPESTIPTIMLSGLKDTFSKVSSFDLGAVDYVTKPFSTEELLARINAKLRRL